MNNSFARIWQIDALRGVAMILMTVFHALVDIRDFFGFADVRYFEPPLLYIGRSSAILFMFVSGISCRFSKNNVRRGLKVLACGMIVTIATYFTVGDLYVRFGILHFLGASMIIVGALERFIFNRTPSTGADIRDRVVQPLIWALSLLSLFAGRVFANMHVASPYLLIFGLTTESFASYDYYPIFPWIGVFFAGYAFGRTVVNNREKLASVRAPRPVSLLGSLGRISLIYYLLHQPALIALFFVFDKLFSVALHL